MKKKVRTYAGLPTAAFKSSALYGNELELEFPLPSNALRPNRKTTNWRSIHAAKHKVRDAACFMAKNAAPEGFLVKTYEVMWYSRTKIVPDEDNVIASCKSYIDGVADALGQNDKEFKFCRVTRAKRERPRLVLTFRDISYNEWLVRAAQEIIAVNSICPTE